MYGNGYGMHGGGWWLFAIFLLVGLGLLVYVAVRFLGPSRTRDDAKPSTAAEGPARSTARGILDERLALGELSVTEYRDRLETLHERL